MKVKHYFDLGNYSVLAMGDCLKKPKLVDMRSVYTQLASDETPHKTLISEVSPVVTVTNKKNSARYHVGVGALEYTSYQSLVQQPDKYTSDITLPMLLSTLRPVNGETTLEVDLYMTVPNVLKDESAARQALEGTHTFSVWYGKAPVEMTAKITVKEVRNEGELVIERLRDLNKIKSNGKTLAIDIGGGTCNTFLYGRVVSDHNSFDGAGGSALAESILNRPAFKTLVGNTLNGTVKVMEAIARGDFNYDENPDWNFKDIYEEEFKRWFKSLLDGVKTRYRAHLPEVSCLLFLGGNANLVPQDKRTGIIYVPEKPELVNLDSLYQTYK